MSGERGALAARGAQNGNLEAKQVSPGIAGRIHDSPRGETSRVRP